MNSNVKFDSIIITINTKVSATIYHLLLNELQFLIRYFYYYHLYKGTSNMNQRVKYLTHESSVKLETLMQAGSRITGNYREGNQIEEVQINQREEHD